MLKNEVDHYTPQKVVNDIDSAQYEKKRGVLRDPGIVTAAQWNALVGSYREDSFSLDDPTGACTTSGDTAICRGTWYDTTTAYAEHPFSVTLVKTNTTVYGWNVASSQLR